MKRVALLLALIALFASCKRRETPVTTSAERPQTRAQAEPAATEDLATMPEYTATNLDGSKFDLAQQRDKVVLLNLWATWCFPCREEIPELEKIHAHYAPRGFAVIGVSVDEGGVDIVKQFATEKNIKYPIVLDPEGKLATILQTSVLPTSVLVDRKGRILWRSTGLVTETDPGLKQAIESAL